MTWSPAMHGPKRLCTSFVTADPERKATKSLHIFWGCEQSLLFLREFASGRERQPDATDCRALCFVPGVDESDRGATKGQGSGQLTAC
jgi:hypothetical protein